MLQAAVAVVIKVSFDIFGIFWLGLGFVVGINLGSFVKVLADRSLVNKSFGGRSYCPHCKQKLAWYDLFPVFSYLTLGGKCRFCKKGIGIDYLLVETVMGLLVAFLFWQSFRNFQFPILNFQSIYNLQFTIALIDLLFKTFLISVLVILFITDLRKMLIPDKIVKPAIVLSMVFLVLITVLKEWYLYFSLAQTELGRLLLPPYSDYFQRHALLTAYPLLGSVIMAAAIGGFFWLLIVITRGRGMGGGDVKLGALMGLALGFPNALIALMLAFILGAFVSLILIALKRKHFGQSVPFGPFLVIGSLIALFWGNQLLDWYLKLSV